MSAGPGPDDEPDAVHERAGGDPSGSPTGPAPDAGGRTSATEEGSLPPRIVRQSNDLSYVRYSARSGPEGLERAVYVHSGLSPLTAHGGGTAGGEHPSTRRFPTDRRPPRASVLLAAALSVVLPGAGHWYLGRRRTALPFLLLVVALWVVGFSSGVLGGVLVAGALPLITVTSVVWCVVDARRNDHRDPPAGSGRRP